MVDEKAENSPHFSNRQLTGDLTPNKYLGGGLIFRPINRINYSFRWNQQDVHHWTLR